MKLRGMNAFFCRLSCPDYILTFNGDKETLGVWSDVKTLIIEWFGIAGLIMEWVRWVRTCEDVKLFYFLYASGVNNIKLIK